MTQSHLQPTSFGFDHNAALDFALRHAARMDRAIFVFSTGPAFVATTRQPPKGNTHWRVTKDGITAWEPDESGLSWVEIVATGEEQARLPWRPRDGVRGYERGE